MNPPSYLDKRYYLAFYGKQYCAEILAPKETTEEEARQIMLKNLDSLPRVYMVDGTTPDQTRMMIRSANIVIKKGNW